METHKTLNNRMTNNNNTKTRILGKHSILTAMTMTVLKAME